MSQVTPRPEGDTPQDNTFWRSSGQLENTKEYRKFLYKEFQEGASVLESPMSRRTFIKLMGASAALAGVSGCTIRKQEQRILPYAKAPEEVIPGKGNFYATTFILGEEAIGVLAESFEGRPTKIEGNPSHPQSLGAAKSFQQGSVLELYDPDRLQKPVLHGKSLTPEQLEKWLGDNSSSLENKGQGLAILTETQISPTFYRLLDLLRQKLPSAKIFRYDPLNQESVYTGIHSVTGQWLSPYYDFAKANIVVSLDADFLGNDVGSIAYTKAFSTRRDPQNEKGINRLYAIEHAATVTGAKADHRLRIPYFQIESVLWALSSSLVKKGVCSSDQVLKATQADVALSTDILKVVDAIADDLAANKGKSILIAGPQQPASVHALVFLLNKALGNITNTLTIREINFSKDLLIQKSSLNSIVDLSELLQKGQVETLVILGGNPVYTAPSNLNFEEKMAKAKTTIHLTLYKNETTEKATLGIPRKHYLESWGDAKAIDGTQSIVQPLIEPIYPSKSDAELMSQLIGAPSTDFELVQNTWKSKGILLESQWKKWLHEGIITGPSAGLSTVSIKDNGFVSAFTNQVKASKLSPKDAIELVFTPSYSVYDGRFANNGWLQELPDPITKLTWDNAAIMSKKTATKYHIKDGDLVEISTKKSSIQAAVMTVPGIADNSISISLGYGQAKAGRVGHDTGFNVYVLRTTKQPFAFSNVSLKKLGKTYKLASTQEHGSMEGRHLIRIGTESEYKKNPEFAKEMVETPPLNSSWPEKKYDTGNQWGLSIDLSKCTGCNACITACQAENNIPIVGKKQVLNGREMHWIRLDRYFEGTEEEAQVVHQPMTCLQCEMAPCEQVCPVAATTHSDEGLNEMTYNRCVGTRYCSNNCPTKVRRFNFFDYHQRNPQSVAKERKHLFDYMREPDPSVQRQFNPDVTVRMRGIMEKCTYCIQRINQSKISAKNEGRDVIDGEIKTACQQTCPAEAIVFGNILDPESQVSKKKAEARDYHILKEWNLKPRTSYLAGIRNPNPALVSTASKGA